MVKSKKTLFLSKNAKSALRASYWKMKNKHQFKLSAVAFLSLSDFSRGLQMVYDSIVDSRFRVFHYSFWAPQARLFIFTLIPFFYFKKAPAPNNTPVHSWSKLSRLSPRSSNTSTRCVNPIFFILFHASGGPPGALRGPSGGSPRAKGRRPLDPLYPFGKCLLLFDMPTVLCFIVIRWLRIYLIIFMRRPSQSNSRYSALFIFSKK